MSADQFVHMLRHATAQGGDVVPFRYAHVANYDPTQHRVRVIIPSMTDDLGQPLLSSWMPFSTMSAGAGYGVQVIPFGGATADDPTAGEQVLVGTFDRQRGVSAVLASFYHGTNKPPATNLPTTQDGFTTAADPAVPGDIIISAPPATTGGANSFIRIRKSGQIQIWSAGPVTADVIGGMTATVNTGDLSVLVTKGNATVQAVMGVVHILGSAVNIGKAVTDTFLALCNSTFWTVFNTHEHGTSGPPTPLADATTLTTIFKAE